MIPRTTWLLLLLTAALASTASAEQLLREVIQHSNADARGGEAPEIEVVLGFNAQLASPFRSEDGRVFEARLVDPAGSLDAWQHTELTFQEEGYDIARVTVEGDSGRGFSLAVEFDEPVDAVTLPQYVSNRIALKYEAVRRAGRQAAVSRDDSPDSPWVVDLGVDAVPLSIDDIPRSLLLNRVLYAAPARSGTTALRLGVFDANKARSVQRELLGSFPGARPVGISAREAAYARHMRLNSARIEALFSTSGQRDRTSSEAAEAPRIDIAVATPGNPQAPTDPAPATLSSWDPEADRGLLGDAKAAYLAGNLDRAIALYTRAADTPEFRQEALEMLGVAREQKRQFAQAKLAYETLLTEAPEGPAAERVRNRLQALLRMKQTPRTLRKPEAPRAVSWNTSAHLSQFYRRYSLDIDGRDKVVPIDGLFSDLDLFARRASSSSAHEFRVGLGHVQDFTDRNRSQGVRIQTLYWDSSIEALRSSLRLGRQQRRGSGVLGRFDGVTAGFRATSNVRINALGGYLQDSSYDDPDSDRPFWGVNAEIGLLDDALTVTPFFVQQKYDGVIDRQAVGMQAEMYTDRGNYFGILDYDLHHRALNHAYLSANLKLTERTRVYGNLDHRRNPYLTTRNALIGQTSQDLSELGLLLVEDDLEDIAADRTAVSTQLRIGLDQQLGGGWVLSTDASVSDFDATEASLAVAALEAHQDFYVGTQLRADNFFGRGNYGAVQLRYFETDHSRTAGLMLNSRFTLAQDWWLYPRVSLDQREYLDSGQKQLRIRPTMRLDYRYGRSLRLELEVGYEWTMREMVREDLDMQGLFIRAGYRALF